MNLFFISHFLYHLEFKFRLSNHQYGFRSSKSTSTWLPLLFGWFKVLILQSLILSIITIAEKTLLFLMTQKLITFTYLISCSLELQYPWKQNFKPYLSFLLLASFLVTSDLTIMFIPSITLVVNAGMLLSSIFPKRIKFKHW